MQTKNKERLRNLGQWHPYLALRSALSLVSSTLGKSRGSCLRRSVSSGGKPPPSLTPAHAGHRRSLAWKVLLLGAPFVISTEAKLKRKEEGWGVGNGDVAAWSSCMLRNVQKKKAIHKNSHWFQNPEALRSRIWTRSITYYCDHFIDTLSHQYNLIKVQLTETFTFLAYTVLFIYKYKKQLWLLFSNCNCFFGPRCFSHCSSLLARGFH